MHTDSSTEVSRDGSKFLPILLNTTFGADMAGVSDWEFSFVSWKNFIGYRAAN
jgi:hypothetical protein